LDPVSPQALLARAVRESRLGMMEAAAATAQQVIHRSPAEASAVLRLDARIRLVWIQFQNGEHAAARRTAALAVRKAAAIGDRVRESLARSVYARVLAEGQEVVEAADEVVAALRLSRATDHPLSRSVACVNLAIICSRLALYEAAVDLSLQAVAQAERADDPEAYAHALSNYGSLHADYLYRYRLVPEVERETYLDLAIRESRRATLYAHAQEDGEMQRLSGYNLVEFLLMRGDLVGAEAAWDAVEAAPGVPSRRSQVQRGHVRSLLLLGQGDPTRWRRWRRVWNVASPTRSGSWRCSPRSTGPVCWPRRDSTRRPSTSTGGFMHCSENKTTRIIAGTCSTASSSTRSRRCGRWWPPRMPGWRGLRSSMRI
jgi:tetratricopeptide (TPR) repeat protein